MSPRARVWIAALAFAALVVGAVAAFGPARGERSLRERTARELAPAVQAFLAAVASREPAAVHAAATPDFRAAAPEDRLRPVIESFATAMGAPVGSDAPEIEVDPSTDDEAGRGVRTLRCATRFERGPGVLEVRVARAPGGPWLVDACVVTSDAFVWTFRALQ